MSSPHISAGLDRLIFIADFISTNTTGIPVDLRPASMGFWGLTFTSSAVAPEMYTWDANGHIRPADGRNTSPEEQEWMERVNRQHDDHIRNRNQMVDDFIRCRVPDDS